MNSKLLAALMKRVTLWQLCPRCLGDGTVPVNSQISTTAVPIKTCNVCSGKGIIPMAVIEEQSKPEKTLL